MSGTAQAVAGSYRVTFSVNDGHNAAVTRSLTVTVDRQTALVTPSGANPSVVKAKRAVTLRAAIAQDPSSHGSISNAAPVTYTLTGLDSGATYSCTAATSGGQDGTLDTQCQFRKLAADVYRIQISVGGNYYQGSAESMLTVANTAGGSVQVSGLLKHEGVEAPLSFQAKYGPKGRLTGRLVYIEHRDGGDAILRSTSLSSLIIKNNRAYIQGRATLNGAANYHFVVTVDRKARGRFGLWVTDAKNRTVSDLTFSPIALTSGSTRISLH